MYSPNALYLYVVPWKTMPAPTAPTWETCAAVTVLSGVVSWGNGDAFSVRTMRRRAEEWHCVFNPFPRS